MILNNLIFGNAFDVKVHVDFSETPSAGTKFVGPLQLLAELEQKAGLVHPDIKDYVRVEAWKKAIEAAKPAIFSASYDKDKNGVAAQLLRWRDALVMAGWNKDNAVKHPILDALKQVDAHFCYSGIADRWVRMLDYCTNNALNGFTIEVTNCKEHIHPTIVAVLDAISNKNKDSVMWNPIQENKVAVIKAYSFEDSNDAYLNAALCLDPEKDVIVCQNDKMLNNFLNLASKQNTTSCLRDTNAPILQLFKLLLLMMCECGNIFNMVAYLKTKPCPVENGGRLADYLMRTGGWGDGKEWEEFKQAKDKNGDAIFSTEEQKAFEQFHSITSMGNPTIGKIAEEVGKLKEWASHQSAADTVREEIGTLKDFCHRFIMTTEGKESEPADEKAIKDLINQIYANGEYVFTEAKVGSFDAYSSLECIYSRAEKVVWVDCYGNTMIDYDYGFLNSNCQKALRKAGLRMWSNQDQAAAKVAALSIAARRCAKELWLYVPKKVCGEAPASCSLLSSLGVKDFGALAAIPTKKSSLMPLTAKSNYICIKPNTIKEHRTKSGGTMGDESFSSLNMLINSPMDYVMQYLCGMYAPSISNLESINTTKGTVAHRTLEIIVNRCNKKVEKIKNEITNNLDCYIKEATNQVGMILLLPENDSDYKELKFVVKRAFENLIGIIEDNGLSIVGIELEYNEPTSVVTNNKSNLTAKVDLVLEDKEKNKYIFDLKYSKPNKYTESLDKNYGKILQLDIYKHCMEQADNKVVFKGFFLLTDGRLYTADNCLKSSSNISVISPKKSAFAGNSMDALSNGYEYRYEEFKKGNIEEGEGVTFKKAVISTGAPAVEPLDYHREQAAKSLYPIELDGAKKAENKYSNFKNFKGGHK